MKQLNEIIRIKESAERDLLRRPYVTGVEVGYKIKGGKATSELAIRVHVKKKTDNVPPDELIPSTIGDVITDIIESDYGVPLAGPDPNRYDIIVGGISVSPCSQSKAGTIGVVVVDNDPNHLVHPTMVLSCWHVLSNGVTFGEFISQPGVADGGRCFVPNSTSFGILDRGTIQDGVGVTGIDAAVASVLPPGVTQGRDSLFEILEIGPISGSANVRFGANVRKRGRTTGLTFGAISSVSLSKKLDYPSVGPKTMSNQFSIQPDITRSSVFANQGDSGAAVVTGSADENGNSQVVGLLIAGAFEPAGNIGIATPITAVLDALKVRI